MTPPVGRPPSAADLQAIADTAFAEIPEKLRRMVRGVAILIEEFPDDRTMDDMGLESPFELLGLYQGVSLDRKSVSDVPEDIDRIFLYRRPLLDYWCETEEPLAALVRNTLIHEIGHHFGLSDEEMERLEAEAAGGPA